MVRAPLLHRGGRRFESYTAHLFTPRDGGFVLIMPIYGGWWVVRTVEGYSSVQLCAIVCSIDINRRGYTDNFTCPSGIEMISERFNCASRFDRNSNVWEKPAQG